MRGIAADTQRKVSGHEASFVSEDLQHISVIGYLVIGQHDGKIRIEGREAQIANVSNFI